MLDLYLQFFGAIKMIPIKIWTDDVEESAKKQLENIASLPWVFHHVAAMPDVH